MITPLDILSLETWILIFSVLALIRYYIHKRWQFLKNLGIPHDPPSILGLGNLGDFFKDPDLVFSRDLIRKKKYGYVYGSYLGLQPRIVISDPAILKQIYIKEFSSFRDRQRTFGKVNGKEMNTALTAASGDQWKRIRNTLTPTFSTSKLKEMIGLIEKCTDQMIVNLEKTAKENEGRFETKEVFGKLSMDVICSAAFSTNVHSQDGSENEVVSKTKSLFNRSLFGSPLVLIFLLFPWTENIAEKFEYSVFGNKLLDYFRRLVDALLRTKTQAHEKPRVDIMQQMLLSEISEKDVKEGAVKGITRREIIGNSILMILAGYETTANTIIFLAYNLATHKEVQGKVKKEIQDTIKEYGGLTYEGVNSMKYLMMCFNESQRLYGAVPRNSRYCERDVTISGIHIPAGVHVDVPIYGLSHDEEYWDEPYAYKPERMEDMSKIDPMVFQPFGGGPRNCIGMRFAMMEVKMAICKILEKFDLDVCSDTPPPPLRMTFKASMQPKDKIFLKVVPRDEEIVA